MSSKKTVKANSGHKQLSRKTISRRKSAVLHTTAGVKELIPHKLYTTHLAKNELDKLNNIIDKCVPSSAPPKKDSLKYFEVSRKLQPDDKKMLIDTATKLLTQSGLWVRPAGLIEVFKYEMKGGAKSSIFTKHRDNDSFETTTVNSCVIYLRRDTDIQNCNMNYYTIDPAQTKFRKILNPKLITHTIPTEEGTAIMMKGNLLHQQEVCKGTGTCTVLVIRLYEP